MGKLRMPTHIDAETRERMRRETIAASVHRFGKVQMLVGWIDGELAFEVSDGTIATRYTDYDEAVNAFNRLLGYDED